MPEGTMGSDIGSRPQDSDGSDTGASAAGDTFFGLASFFLATFFAVFLTAEVALVFVFAFLRAGFDAFFTTFFALLDVFAGRPFFLTLLRFSAVRFAFATGRLFALLFFFAMIGVLLAVLRLPGGRVSPKKSAVICA